MIGCSFVANRHYFGELGLLDSGMDVYGGENIELGIRVSVPKYLHVLFTALTTTTGWYEVFNSWEEHKQCKKKKKKPVMCVGWSKVWMCGGSMEVLPCSRVAHVARTKKPYHSNIAFHTRRNALRVAEVWLDEYKSNVYLAWNIPTVVRNWFRAISLFKYSQRW